MVFDPSEPNIDYKYFDKQYWNYTVYGEYREEITYNAPGCYGFGLNMRDFLDSDCTGDSNTSSSRTGFIVYLNNAHIY